MGKLTTATWMQGAVLAFGHFGLIPGIAKADYSDYAAYPPQAQPFQVQYAAYQQPGWGGEQINPDLPPEIQPYDPGMAPESHYQPQQAPRYQQQAHTLPASWRPTPPPAQAVTALQAYITPERRALMDAAYRALGVTYRWGGNTPREGFDCSGLTKFTHKNVNVSIPRTAAEQSQASRTISRQQLRPGDMIFFRTSGKTVNHVGIYVGNGKFIHAASGGGRVTLDDLRRGYWQQRLVKYGTFLA